MLDDDCTINHNTPDYMALQLQGARSVVLGGINGGFVGPAAWDPVDGAGTLPYAVIRFTGEYGRAERTRIFNIRRVGVQFKDVNNGLIEGCLIDGNQPLPTYPLSLTNLHAVHIDVVRNPPAAISRPSTTPSSTPLRVSTWRTTAVAALVRSVTRGCVISGNIFYNMWDHGVCTNYADGITITGNNFNDCHIGIAASGLRHTITGNSFLALSTAFGEIHVPEISLRDPQFCVVSANVFFGTLTAPSPFCIDLAAFNADVAYNVVANNTIRSVGRGTSIRLTCRNLAEYFVYDNIVEGNNISSPGRDGSGIIAIEGNPASGGIFSTGNIVRGN